MRGSKQLLLEGTKMIPLADYEFLIILEADTWIYGDRLIEKYAQKLVEKNAVWASALWCDRYFSLAVDFALLSAAFLQENTAIFDFEDTPECTTCNYLLDGQFRYLLIRENMNVMIPGYLKTYPFAPTGRFYSFPKSRMVTHHIESIPGGMLTKKKRFNVLANTSYFPLETPFSFLSRCGIRFAHFVEKLLPRRTWYSKRKKMIFEKG